MASSSTSSLYRIPREIRLEIYSYLLSDRNVTSHTPNTIKPKFETALFRVNKLISQETLSYFYTENAFVVVECPQVCFLLACHRAMPMIMPSPNHVFRNYVLKIRLQNHGPRFDKKDHDSGRAIFSARHLATFVRLRNSEHCLLRDTGTYVKVDLTYRVQTRSYRGSARVLDWVTEGMEGLRPVEDPKMTRIIVKIRGDLNDPEKSEKIGRITLPSYNYTTALDEAKLAKERGNALYKAGDYYGAHTEYTVSRYMFNSFKECYQRDPTLMEEYEALMINICTNTSLVQSKLGRHATAVIFARSAIDVAVNRLGQDSFEQKAKYRFRLGSALADNGQDLEAIDELKAATCWAPNNVVIRAKLKQILTRMERTQKKSDASFRSNLSRAFV